MWTGLCRVAHWMFLRRDFHGGAGDCVPPSPPNPWIMTGSVLETIVFEVTVVMRLSGNPSPLIHHENKHTGDAMI